MKPGNSLDSSLLLPLASGIRAYQNSFIPSRDILLFLWKWSSQNQPDSTFFQLAAQNRQIRGRHTVWSTLCENSLRGYGIRAMLRKLFSVSLNTTHFQTLFIFLPFTMWQEVKKRSSCGGSSAEQPTHMSSFIFKVKANFTSTSCLGKKVADIFC